MSIATAVSPNEAVLREALRGLTAAPQKTLPPWLFYDEHGSRLFEQITALPEYYLTRTERALLAAHSRHILREFNSAGIVFSNGQTLPNAGMTIAELGAGNASKTGLLLCAATRGQSSVFYQPIDVSSAALEKAAATLAVDIPGVTVLPQLANYITESYSLFRPQNHRILTLYIGSSIGNFSPSEAASILSTLRHHLQPGDALLLGADLAPGQKEIGCSPSKSIATVLAAYDDTAGVTAAFNKNILARLNRELDTDFNLDTFAHRALWNACASRIEMHLESLIPQTINLRAGNKVHRIEFARGETIHTENSYKFTDAALDALLTGSGFTPIRAFHDPAHSFAIILACASIGSDVSAEPSQEPFLETL